MKAKEIVPYDPDAASDRNLDHNNFADPKPKWEAPPATKPKRSKSPIFKKPVKIAAETLLSDSTNHNTHIDTESTLCNIASIDKK